MSVQTSDFHSKETEDGLGLYRESWTGLLKSDVCRQSASTALHSSVKTRCLPLPGAECGRLRGGDEAQTWRCADS